MRRLMRNILCFITLAMIVGLMPGVMTAAKAEDYQLWVCGVQATSGNEGKEIVPPQGSGNYKYDNSNGTMTLTLNTCEWKGTGTSNRGICYQGEQPLHIVLNGKNKITNHLDDGTSGTSIGLYSEKAVTISGDGYLKVVGEGGESAIGIQCKGDLTINGKARVTVDATEGSSSNYGVCGEKSNDDYSQTKVEENASLTADIRGSASYGVYNSDLVIAADAKAVHCSGKNYAVGPIEIINYEESGPKVINAIAGMGWENENGAVPLREKRLLRVQQERLSFTNVWSFPTNIR